MDEEDEIHLNWNSPKGKLIKLLETKCKKPEVDSSFSEILERYKDITEQQKNYLQNGIFNINFAEEALFVQGCASYYAKRVDKLYDQVLASHLRLVQYDEKHAKATHNSNKNKKEERRLELKKLENRMNKSKRKKITLVEPEEQDAAHEFSSSGLTSLVVNDLEEAELPKEPPFESDKNLVCEWDTLDQHQYLADRDSNVMWEYNCQGYTLGNELLGEDHTVYDAEDPEEFNSKYSKVPTFNHIKHLFEYNDNCLLPDSKETIAKLRLAFYGTKLFIRENKISRDASYEQYKDEFSVFAKNFYSEERKRIQNMPQNTLCELNKFFNILLKRENDAKVKMVREANKLSLGEVASVTLESLIRAPLSEIFNMHFSQFNGKVSVMPGIMIPKCVVDKLTGKVLGPDEKIYEDVHKSKDFEDSAIVTSEGGEKSINEADRDLEMEEVDKNKDQSQLEADAMFRSDSGYFESGFETDIEDNEDHDAFNMPSTNENVAGNITANNDNRENATIHNEAQVSSDHETLENVEKRLNENEQGISGSTEKSPNESDNFQSESCINAEGLEKGDVASEEVMSLRPVRTRIILKPAEFKIPRERAPVKRKIAESDTDEPSAKQRKLTLKQIEKLQQSIIKPVHEMRWESFFSMNYQTQTGEGIVNPIDYESDSDSEEVEQLPAPVEYHSDHDGSHISDHSYCRPDSAIELGSVHGISGEIHESRNSSGNDLDELITHFEEGWDAIVRDHMYTPLIPRSSNNTPVCTTSALSGNEKSVHETERKEVRKRVENWKSHIQQKLKKLDEHCFDIHEYGADIINSMSVGDSRAFRDLVAGRSQTEAIRYFITSLHLANTNNIELCGIQPGQLSNDTLQVKLLDKERYHEKLDEYHAPSEEMLREKLSRMRKLKKQNQMASIPSATNSQQNVSSDDLCQTPVLEKSTWKGKSIRKVNLQSNSTNVCVLPPKRSKSAAESVSSGYFSCSDIESPVPSTSTDINLNVIQNQMSCASRRSSKRLFQQHSQETNSDMCSSGFSSEVFDEISFLKDFEGLTENSETPLQSTPRCLKVVIEDSSLLL